MRRWQGSLASLRLGFILTLVSSGALALPLEEYHAKADDTLDLFVAGSSAQDNTLEQLFRLICEANTLDIYRRSDGNVRLLFCRTATGAAAVPGIPPGRKLAFHKSSVGGSGSGVGPLIQLTPVEFLNVADIRANFAARCAANDRKRHSAEGNLTAFDEHVCQNPTPAHEIPDAGISDVEPRFFLGLYNLTQDAAEALSVTYVNAFIFGVPVDRRLRDALQAARFPRTDPCNPANPHYRDPVGGDGQDTWIRGESEKCMPGLTRPQVAGLFAGTVRSWSMLLTAAGLPLATRTGASISAPAGISPPADDHVYVCRRVDTSGTQAAYEMFFLNQRCATGVRPFVKVSEGVFMGSGTADVKACLNELDRQNRWAIGIMSTENVARGADDRWRFIKVDGVAPSLVNTYDGRWPFFVEQSYQWRNERSGRPLVGAKLGLMSQIARQLQNPTILKAIDRDFQHAWGQGGVMALATEGLDPPRAQPGRPVDARALADEPVLAVSHEGSSCGAVIAAHPTTLP